jgi:hypothetical protein
VVGIAVEVRGSKGRRALEQIDELALALGLLGANRDQLGMDDLAREIWIPDTR